MRPPALLCGCLILAPSIAFAQKPAEKDLAARQARLDDGHVVLETKYGDRPGDQDHILTFCADGTVLATRPGSVGGVTGWDVKTGEKVYEIRSKGPGEMVYCGWPDVGAFVWTASKALDLRDAATGKTIRPLDRGTKKLKPEIVGEVAIVSPDGQLIADIGSSQRDREDLVNRRRPSGPGNRKIILRDTKSRQEKQAWELPIPDVTPDEDAPGADTHVVRLSFSSDSTKVAAVLSDGQILAWDVSGDKPIATHSGGRLSGKFADNGMVRWLPENRGLALLDSTGLYEWLVESPKAVRKVDFDWGVQDRGDADGGEKKERKAPRKRRGKRQGGNMYPEPGINEGTRRQAPASNELIPACISLDGRFAIRLRQKGGLRSASDGGAGSLAAELLDLENRKKLGELHVSRQQSIVSACIAPRGNAVALELEDGVIRIFTMDVFQDFVTSNKQLAAVNPSRPERTEEGRRGRR